jgi:RIO-like serine/threonine protein kinase
MPLRRSPFSRREFEADAGSSLAKSAWYKPRILPFTFRGFPLVAKDYSRCPFLWRLLFGRAMVARESTIYSVLDGLPGVPRYFGRIDADAFAVERVEGADFSGYRKGTLPPELIDRLYGVVHDMHGRGVVHWDLRQRKNVIAGPGNRPFIIDFETAFRFPPGGDLMRLARLPDLSGVAKLKVKHHPDRLTEEDRRWLDVQRFRPLRSLRVAKRQARRRNRT